MNFGSNIFWQEFHAHMLAYYWVIAMASRFVMVVKNRKYLIFRKYHVKNYPLIGVNDSVSCFHASRGHLCLSEVGGRSINILWCCSSVSLNASGAALRNKRHWFSREHIVELRPFYYEYGFIIQVDKQQRQWLIKKGQFSFRKRSYG